MIFWYFCLICLLSNIPETGCKKSWIPWIRIRNTAKSAAQHSLEWFLTLSIIYNFEVFPFLEGQVFVSSRIIVVQGNEHLQTFCYCNLNQGWGSGFGKISDPGLCTPNDRRYLKYYWMKILDNFASLLFCFHTFGVRRSL